MTIQVGLVYNNALAKAVARNGSNMFDVASIVPETLWHESSETRQRYRWVSGALQQLDSALGALPNVFHGIGLSLGSGLPLDLKHLDQIMDARDRLNPIWYSEHLAAFRIEDRDGKQHRAGIGLPVPFDYSTLRLMVPKVARVVSRLGMPVLLENSAIYVDIPHGEVTEAGFLNRLSAEAGSAILLDLHNLLVNEVNLGWCCEDFLAELDLSRVIEIHVAGGEMLGRWYTDAHSGSCPDRVWSMLESVIPNAPALRLITLEVHQSRYEQLGMEGLQAELSRIRVAISGGSNFS
jgi:uncharacterized protein